MIDRADMLNIVQPEEPSYRIKKVSQPEKIGDKPKNPAETEVQKPKSEKVEEPEAGPAKDSGNGVDIYA